MSKQPTFVTLTKLQNREPTLLQTAIDNTRGKLNVALKSFHYEVGYSNIHPSATFIHDSSTTSRQSDETRFTLYEGMYTFEQISRFFMESVPGITLRLNLYGLVEFYVPENLGIIKLDDTLLYFLGLENAQNSFKAGIYTYFYSNKYMGSFHAKIIVHKWLYIYLDQLSTTSNIVDGAPSTLLAIIPASPIEGIINITSFHPTYKKLEVGHICQLNLRVLDENGTIVNNHDRSMTAVLDIRENDVCSFD